MKRIFALALSLALSIFILALSSCANTVEGASPEVGNTVHEETDSPLFSPDSAVILTSEEENEIILAYAAKINDSEPNVSEYKVRCYGVAHSEEYGKIYAVIVESPGYKTIGFDEYFESPYDYPVTREYKPDVYDVWSDMRAPLLIYKNGEFFAWRSSHVGSDFIDEVLDTYRKCNEAFYDAIGD